jgi:hypothetical protein
MVLQDIVNELGRRLEYRVTNGRYQGTVNAIGFDGLWISPEGHTIVVEVKTTDAYRISLDTIARYREKLLTSGLSTTPSSILIVVGREDTGELEAQVRGSRHAWDIRLISADALIKLVELKQNADGPETGRKIRSLLTPMEYTRLDEMIDVMFTTAKDVESAVEAEAGEVAGDTSNLEIPKDEAKKGVWKFTDAALLQDKRENIISALSQREGTSLIKRTRALYWDASHSIRVACTMSKRYDRPECYWFAHHPRWDEFLAEVKRSFLVLGCMDLDFAFTIPHDVIHPLLDAFYISDPPSGRYWHLNITEAKQGEFALTLPRRGTSLPLTPYRIAV